MEINQHSTGFVFILVLIVTESFSVLGDAQDQNLNSNSQARRVVQKSEKALGQEALRTIIVGAQGHELWEGQGLNPNNPVLDSRLELQWRIDLNAKYLSYKRRSYTGPNLTWCFQQSVKPNAQYSELCHSGALHDDSSIPLPYSCLLATTFEGNVCPPLTR